MTDTLSSGILSDELEPGIRPQDDLYRHVNARWLARTPIPADKARYGSFMVLAEEAEKAVRDIIVEAQSAEPGTLERKVGDLYASFIDEERIEALGAAPLAPHLAAIDTIDDKDSLLSEIGRLEREGARGFAQLFVDNDPGDPERYLVFVEQGGLGLPDESYYREDAHAATRDAYLAHLERMLALAGLEAPAERAVRIMALETHLASHHWDKVRNRDSQATYNLRTWAEWEEAAPGLDLARWRDAFGITEQQLAEVVLRQPSFHAGLAAAIADRPLEEWTDWLRWSVIRSMASYLSRDFVDATFDFYGRTLTGTPEQRARWKRGVSFVEGAMGEAVGEVYVARHYPPEAKAAMDELIAMLIEAYRQSISELEWMTAETRERALDKLSKFTPKIGYPVRWRDYSSLEVVADDLVANVRAAGEFEFQRELGKIGRPIDRDEWFMTPQTVNAYYNPGFNEIVFPAAILQFPFFDAGRDAAANYGAIGAVIGHEIGHGFDDQGSRYDGDGRLRDWWTEADRAAFEERTGSLIAQYDALEPSQAPGHHVNGALTIGENIGDLGGLGIAWKAYLLSLDGEEPPVIDGLTGAQRFFLSWAQAWQLAIRPEEALRLLSIDPHSPNEFRCNQIVRNIGAFYEAFSVTPDDALWLDETERVSIW
ncbi:M13 family metallopeptidase [Yonghaparkia sp. Root332]|uniref:M13 family metallopeptidase n=1 Tax=Yonghaparkia sp. Root332 TaxID=1736516 RepID=UPI0006FB9994|nr:M13-type metalloendopeptidase [Yonghaparkia sp. Root332]KQV25957.1 peptidase M13 [Yonghaparkia sp. Root332]